MRIALALIGLACILLLGACQKSNDVGIANPASVYCEENSGQLEIVTAADGSQSGVCTLNDGTKCDEWAYFRGECGSKDTLCGPSCPQLSSPGPDFCKDGRVIPPTKDSCGCLGPPRCEAVACTADAKVCPDGTAVGRVGPECEFAQCPSSCTCPPGYRKDGDACNPECYYSRPACLAPSIPCEPVSV